MSRVGALIFALAAPATAHAQLVIDYETDRFCSNQGGVTLLGDAYYTGGSPDCYLVTTPGNGSAGAGWYSTPFDITAVNTVETRFEYTMGGGVVDGSGMTFTLQSAGTSTLGTGGGGLGYYYFVSPSIAVELDAAVTGGSNDPNDNHIGINLDGSVFSSNIVTPGLDINSGSIVYVWIDMDVVAQTIDVFVSNGATKPGAPTVAATGVNLAGLGTTVYAGFTSGAWQDWNGYTLVSSDTTTLRSWYLEAGEPDSDGDGVPDSLDVCPGFDDTLDADGDAVPDGCDNCVNTVNATQDDADGDGQGDACDPCPADDPDDTDGDGVCDSVDVCPGFSDLLDSDGDLIPTGCDNCPNAMNGSQTDTDSDGAGDACDPCPVDPLDDSDGDGSCDSADICPGYDDFLDSDGDTVVDCLDPCPADNPNDTDGDTICDSADVCPGYDDLADADSDGTPDCLDPCPVDPFDDSDGDGVCDSNDLCPGYDDTADVDGDGNPDDCDPCPNDYLDDSDGDGSCDSTDICPGYDDFLNSDGDLAPDCLDPCPQDYLDDSDGDGSCDGADICPGYDDFLDTDGDGTPDCVDACPTDPTGDDDGDGVCNYADVCPGFDDNEDYDGDGIPNGCDTCIGVPIDSDGDGVADPCDICPGYDDTVDTDGDQQPDACDYCPYDAFEADADGDGFLVCDDCDDFDGTVFPGALGEVVADGIDQDCSGTELCYEDLDGDGFGSTVVVELTGLDCAAIPGGSDNDQDCDDSDAAINPDAPEIDFSGVDEDCDGYIDEDDPTGTATGTATGTGTGFPGTDSSRDWNPDGDVPADSVKLEAVGCGCDSTGGGFPTMGLLLLIGLVRRRAVSGQQSAVSSQL